MDLNTLRTTCTMLELEWGTRPHVVLACAGDANEHWQIYRFTDLLGGLAFPRYIIWPDGRIQPHPDASAD